MTQSSAYREALQKLKSISKRLPRRPSAGVPPTILPRVLPTIPPLQLSKTLDNFKEKLIANDVHPRVFRLVVSHAIKLEALYQKAYTNACQMLLLQDASQEASLDKVRHLQPHFSKLFETKEMAPLLKDILKTNESIPRPLPTPQEDKKAFNHKSTPLLEDYFSRNAYPSPSDRMILARDTNMTPRQIEVWFQNHRTRSKREGKVFKRDMKSILSSPSDTSNILPDLAPIVRESTVSQSSGISAEISPFLPNIAPSHAFPNSYPPRCDSDPFPNVNGQFVFPPPIWPRKRTVKVVATPADTDMDRLVADFIEKLSFRVSSNHAGQVRRARSSTPSSDGGAVWYEATTVVPYPAPLPALLNAASQSQSQRSEIFTFLPARQLPCQSKPTGYVSWENVLVVSPGSKECSVLPSVSPRSVSSSSTSSLQSLSFSSTISSRNSSPSSSPRLGILNQEEIFNLTSQSIPSIFDLDSYNLPFPDIFKAVSPTLDHFLSSLPLPMQTASA